MAIIFQKLCSPMFFIPALMLRCDNYIPDFWRFIQATFKLIHLSCFPVLTHHFDLYTYICVNFLTIHFLRLNCGQYPDQSTGIPKKIKIFKVFAFSINDFEIGIYGRIVSICF